MTHRLGFGGVVLLLAWSQAAFGPCSLPAQTPGALRAPEKSVGRAFPESDGVRSIVGGVNQATRAYVARRLPFKVHFNEFSVHTLYVALKGRRPRGLVYVRSEESQWGLVEVAWSLDLSLRILGFDLLRCRSSHQEAVEKSAFARLLVGRGVPELKLLMTADGELRNMAGQVPDGGEELASCLLRSALKTILVIESVWEPELEKLRDLDMGLESFPDATQLRQLALDPFLALDTTHVRHLRGVRSFARTGEVRGSALQADVAFRRQLLTLRVVIDPDGTITRATPLGSVPGDALREVFEKLVGRRFDDPARAESDAEVTAAELTLLSRRMKVAGALN